MRRKPGCCCAPPARNRCFASMQSPARQARFRNCLRQDANSHCMQKTFDDGMAMVELRVRGVLFDMDGVLMSSLGSVERSWRSYARSRSLDPELAVKMAHGRRAIETIRALRHDLEARSELRVIEDLEVEDNEGLVVLPGVREMLAALPEGSWAIVTSATERLARSRLAFAGIAIPRHFVTADRVTSGKPHPEPYQRGAALLGTAANECIVIEDAPAGVA